MPVGDYRGITLKKELVDKIEQYLSDYPEQGYKSLADFVADAIRRRAEQLKLFQLTPRFEHFNTYGDRVVIRDRKLGPHSVVTLHFQPTGENGFKLYCDHCDSTDCEHVLYAANIPEVTNQPEQKGWKYKGKYAEK